MHATLQGAHTGIPMSVAREFIAADKPGQLPQHVHAAAGGSFDDNLIDAATRLARQHRQPMQMGGSMSMESPWWERSEARAIDRPYGFSMGTGPGRTDKNNVSLGQGAYVLPADVVAGLGEGNSLYGAKAWDDIIHSMPHGIMAPQAHGHMGPPHPPGGRQMPMLNEGNEPQFAEGGKATEEKKEEKPEDDEVPVVTADGEILVPPEHVEAIGRNFLGKGDHSTKKAVKHGHAVLDEFVREIRGRTIKHLASLKGPHGAKNPSVGHNPKT